MRFQSYSRPDCHQSRPRCRRIDCRLGCDAPPSASRTSAIRVLLDSTPRFLHMASKRYGEDGLGGTPFIRWRKSFSSGCCFFTTQGREGVVFPRDHSVRRRKPSLRRSHLSHRGRPEGVSRIEPYSLRHSQSGDILLFALLSPDGQSHSFRLDRILGAVMTEQSFLPRFEVELTPADPEPIQSLEHGSSFSGTTQIQPQ